jgi:DNA-directed RNA polymerase subunit F
MSNKRYTDEQLNTAKKLYMAYKPLKDIVEITGIKKPSISYHIQNKWLKEREDSKSELLKTFTERKKSLMASIASNGLEILAKAMESLKNVDRPLSAAEIKSISTIVSELDKISKLDEGNPTEILAEIKPATTIEIRELLNNDPFLQGEIEDANFKDIDNDDNSDS